MRLFAKEFRGAVFSYVYLAFVAAMAVFFISQYVADGNDDINRYRAGEYVRLLSQPQPGMDSYGSGYTENPEEVMPTVFGKLLLEYDQNSYATYPLGFIKVVRLNAEQQAEVEAAMQAVTGQGYEANIQRYREYLDVQNAGGTSVLWDAEVRIFSFTVDYAAFKAEMQMVDTLLGGGSTYDPAGFATVAQAPLRYEDALEAHNEFTQVDRVTRAYARLFSDYMGIAIGLFAVFVPVGFLLRDKRAGAEALVFSRRCGTVKLVLVRYLASLAAVLLPVLVFAVYATVQAMWWAGILGVAGDAFAFFAYTAGWLVPTAMLCCAVGFFFTTLTATPLGVGVMFLWGFLDISSTFIFGGDYAGTLIIRHNGFAPRRLMTANMGALIQNRLLYVALALVLLCASMAFYELQRRGRLHGLTAWTRRFGRRKKPATAGAAA